MRGQHKGENGKVLVIGGSEDYAGAPALAAMAALRSGCDIAVVAAPEKTAYAINSMSPDLITKKLPGTALSTTHVPVLVKMAEEFDCVLVGPGLGRKKETLDAVRMLCNAIKGKKVLDADALHARPVLKNCIVTPHAKEFEALFGKKAGKANAKKAAKGFVVLLKGKVDVITDGKRVAENKTGNSGMTVGGTGDVLAGLCAGLVAQGAPLFKAAVEAAKINGAAGDVLLGEMGYGFVASDLLDVIPLV
ncbi:NAD(P)H-hydrate dehydratase [archaeon]